MNSLIESVPARWFVALAPVDEIETWSFGTQSCVELAAVVVVTVVDVMVSEQS